MTSGKIPGNGLYEAVLFDLDGTLVDTAPDMVEVLIGLVDRHAAAPLEYRVARNTVSNGALGLLRLAFPEADDERLALLHREYLADYAANLCRSSDVFSPLRELLSAIAAGQRKWGVVTNKPHRLTVPLLDQLGIGAAASCVVSGDTVAERKPHPAPMRHAAEVAGIEPERTIYVGDALRDIQAGAAAGMATIAVGYGYIADGEDPHSWGADAYAADTMTLDRMIGQALNLDS